MVDAASVPAGHSRIRDRLTLPAVLALHLIMAAGWWFMMPGGFPVAHLKWWSNECLPLLAVAACIFAIVCGIRKYLQSAAFIVFGFGMWWIFIGILSRMIFPVSAGLKWLGPVAIGVFLLRCCGIIFRAPRSRRPMVAIVIALGMAMCFVFAQRGEPPSTIPLNRERSAGIQEAQKSTSARAIELGSGLRVWPLEGDVEAHRGRMAVLLHPVLEFWSRSPDRCWTSLAPADTGTAPARHLTAVQQHSAGWLVFYTNDYQSTMHVWRDDDAAHIECRAHLPAVIYSHLNSFCNLTINGHRRLSLAFSPCPDRHIEVVCSDYPVGRPERFAYVDERERFHVVEAASGEKGPFHSLAEGPLHHGEPLSVMLLDEDRPAFKITWDDFSSQASTALSPTAGWGVPANAIEFTLTGDEASSPAAVYMTLAGTSVGRGWDSVGHSAGTYRNRVRIERFAP